MRKTDNGSAGTPPDDSLSNLRNGNTQPHQSYRSRMPDTLLMEEMEALSVKLKEKEQELREIEAGILNEAQKWPQGERAHLYFQLQAADDRYCRLLEAHRRLTRVNQSLEDKLLRLADKFESEKNALVAALSHTTQQLAETHVNLRNTKEELERYKADCSLAVHLLQCRSSNFLSQRIESLPSQFQEKVKGMLDRRLPNNRNNSKNSRNGGKVIKVPIPTFPPTAMVFTVSDGRSANGNDKNEKSVDYVSAAILGKVMEERAKEREEMWQKREQDQKFHCESCVCFGKLGLNKSLSRASDSEADDEPDGAAEAEVASVTSGDLSSISRDLDSVFIDIPPSGSSGSTRKFDGWKDNWMHGQPSDDEHTSLLDGCDGNTPMLVSVHRPVPKEAENGENSRIFPSETSV